jgi:hypothetical protein
MVSKSNLHRKSKQQAITKEGQSRLGDGNQDEFFTQAATKQRRSQALFTGLDDSGPSLIVEDGDNSKTRLLQEIHQTPQRRFVQNDTTSRTSDLRESPDELQGDPTVPPVPRVLNRGNKKTTCSDSPFTDRTEGDGWKDKRPSSPSNIQPTLFAGSRQEQGVIGRKGKRTPKKKFHLHLFDASLFRFGDFEKAASPGSVVQVVINRGNQSIGLADGQSDTPTEVTIPLQKINRVQQGEGESRKIRLGLAKTEGMPDDKVDMELTSEKDKVDICRLLAEQGIKIQDKQR